MKKYLLLLLVTNVLLNLNKNCKIKKQEAADKFIADRELDKNLADTFPSSDPITKY